MGLAIVIILWVALIAMVLPQTRMRDRYARFYESSYGWIIAGFSKRAGITAAHSYMWLVALTAIGAVFFTVVGIASVV